MKNLFTFILSFLFTCLLVPSLQAQTTYTWTGSINSTWTNSGNWSPNRVSPASNDILEFTTGSTFTVTGVPTQTIREIHVTGSTNVTLEAAVADFLCFTQRH